MLASLSCPRALWCRPVLAATLPSAVNLCRSRGTPCEQVRFRGGSEKDDYVKEHRSGHEDCCSEFQPLTLLFVRALLCLHFFPFPAAPINNQLTHPQVEKDTLAACPRIASSHALCPDALPSDVSPFLVALEGDAGTSVTQGEQGCARLSFSPPPSRYVAEVVPAHVRIRPALMARLVSSAHHCQHACSCCFHYLTPCLCWHLCKRLLSIIHMHGDPPFSPFFFRFANRCHEKHVGVSQLPPLSNNWLVLNPQLRRQVVIAFRVPPSRGSSNCSHDTCRV